MWDDENGLADVGRVYIFYGEDFTGPGMASEVFAQQANVKITGVQDAIPSGGALKFGFDLNYIGDMNGDGKDDIIVGAPWYDLEDPDSCLPGFGCFVLLTDSGAAYVYYGRTGDLEGDSEDKADVIYEATAGNAASAFFGHSVAGRGHADNDGRADVIIGAPGYGGTGRAYVFRACNSMAEINVGSHESSTRKFWGFSTPPAQDD